jgi:hypothetical protein
MAVVGLAVGGMVVHPSTAIGTCMPTIRITATTGIGITKQIACRVAASGRHEARRIAANMAKLPVILSDNATLRRLAVVNGQRMQVGSILQRVI